MKNTLCLLGIILLGLTGCSSSDNPPPEPNPQPTMKSFFAPIAPPLSPRDEGGVINTQYSSSTAATSVHTSTTTTTTLLPPVSMNKWFYLVNGVGISEDGSVGTPNMLTVTGPAPNGAPNPNGGTTVSVVPFNPDNTGKALWKAVSSPDGPFYLQSAASFRVNVNTSYPYPNLLVGYGATFAPLILGYVPQWNSSACIFWNQEESPTGDNSQFQQWSYATDSAQLYSYTPGGPSLFNAAGSALVGDGSSAPSAAAIQWYTYPNYYLGQIAAQPASDPSFPGFPITEETYGNCSVPGDGDKAGQQKAYQWISNQCFPGVDDVRSEYTNLSQTAALQSCATLCKTYYGDPKIHNPDPKGNSLEPKGVPITDDDFVAVACQLSNECQYAGDIQATFSIYNTILTNILFADSTTLPKLGNDLNLSQEQSVNVVAIDIIEGILYTALCATGDPALGAFANLMEMGVNTVMAAGGSSAQQLTQTIQTTVADLYSDLGTAMTAITQAASNGENLILQDWGRLKKAGPLTEFTGYNGLGITSDSEVTIEEDTRKGYIISVMQQLLPLAYALSLNPGQSFSQFSDMPSYAQNAYSTFGATSGSYNVNFLYSIQGQNPPSQTVMTTDIMNNGANAFELFNSINGWAGLPLGSSYGAVNNTNLGCSGSVITLFNASPVDTWVTVTPSQGLIAAPSIDFNANNELTPPSGSGNPITLELRPYGYLPIWVTAYGGTDDKNLTVGVDITNVQGDVAAAFTFGGDGCNGKVPTYAWGESYGSGWAGTFNSLAQHDDYPAGLWMTLYQTE